MATECRQGMQHIDFAAMIVQSSLLGNPLILASPVHAACNI